jgi:adenylylsulfate kinase-like enzyme
MTGINSPYEPPEAPDFVADAGQESLEALVEKLLPVVLAAVEEAGRED